MEGRTVMMFWILISGKNIIKNKKKNKNNEKK